MAVTLPYRSESQVSLPAVVRAYGNGKIPDELLLPCGIRSFKMIEPAARACRAMVAAAAAEGVLLDATGTYRSYDQQVALFTSRYTKSATGGKTKKWNGVTYYQKPGVAMAATPGTSNHGLGVTADLAERTAAGQLQSVGEKTLRWLAANGPSFGFWNSVKSEAWHWPYFPGDDIPPAVSQMEGRGLPRPQPAVPQDPGPREAFYRNLTFEGVLRTGSNGVAVEALQWALTRAGFTATIDGSFGPATARAVKEFQTAKSLTVDGLVGPKTWSALGLLGDDQRPQENVTPPAPAKKASKKAAAQPDAPAGGYTLTEDDADGLIAVVARCVGITEAPGALRLAVASAVAEHNGATLERVWRPGDTIALPATITGVRCHTVGAGEDLAAVAAALGGADQATVTAINAWQGTAPKAGTTWYGGAA
jgi:hypothetical protein